MVIGREVRAAGYGVGATLIAAAVTWSGVIPATAGPPPVRPHQHFIGRINGRTGRPHRVVIKMACFGAVRPGETGHPMGGQTVAVQMVDGGRATGYTGTGTTIGAFFGAPPPSADSASYVAFHVYRSKKIPTSLSLPCSGSGTVTFVALPLNFHEHSFGVPVSFVGQP
jgi:hypothetical protein